MDCKETQERLAQYIDQELSSDEFQAISDHVAGCAECRHQYDQQGALDMLLKSCFTPDLPAEHLDGLWPSLAEQLNNETAKGGGSAGNGKDEIHFASSSAMQILKIPDPKASRVEVAAAAVAAPTEAPQEESSPWRWPVALIASCLILVVGVLVYQNRQAGVDGQAPLGQPGLASAQDEMNQGGPGGESPTAIALAPKEEPGDAPEPGSEPAPEPAADQPADQPKADEAAAAPKEEAAPGKEKRKARSKKGKGRARKGSAKAAAGAKPSAVAKPAPAARPKKKAAKKPAGKGDDLLDSLIDNALGSEGSAKAANPKKAKKAAPPPNMDLPEQLSMNQIRAAMGRVKGLVGSCYDQFQVEGRANVQMLITPNGKATKMKIKGKFFGTDTGTCVLKGVKKVKFPKFRGKPMTIKYPFILQ